MTIRLMQAGLGLATGAVLGFVLGFWSGRSPRSMLQVGIVGLSAEHATSLYGSAPPAEVRVVLARHLELVRQHCDAIGRPVCRSQKIETFLRLSTIAREVHDVGTADRMYAEAQRECGGSEHNWCTPGVLEQMRKRQEQVRAAARKTTQ